jgi:hypothetical protein
MRTLEILTFVALLMAFIGFFWPKSRRPRWTAFLPGLAVLWVGTHIVLEGVRWQMVPAYALTALTFLATVRDLLPGATRRGKRGSRGHRALTLIGSVLGLYLVE